MESTSIKHIVQFLSCREYGSSRHHAIPRSCHDADAAQVIAEEKATIPSKNQACELSGQTRATFLMVYSPDGTRMASTHGDHTVRVTHVLSGRCLHILRGHPRTPWCVAFHPSSPDIVASGCLAGEVRIWDLRGGGSEVWRCSKGVSIASLAFHPTSQLLVVAVSNEVVFWDWTQPEPFAACKTAHDYEKVRWVKFDPLGHNLYTGIANGATVHAEPSDVSFVPSDVGGGQAHSRYSTEERARLQRQYQHIVDEIASLRRERLNNQLPPGFVGAWSRAGPSGVGGHPPSPPRPARDGTHFSSSSSSSSCSSASSSSSSSSSAAGLMQRDPGPSGPHGPGSAVAGADSGWQGESRQPLSRVQAEAVELARMYAASTQGTGHGSTAAAGSEAGHPPAMEGGVAPGSPAQPSATSAHTVSSLEALLQEPTPVTTLGGGRRGGATDGDSAVGAESGLGSGYGPGSGPAELEGYRPRSWRQMLLQIGPRNLTPDYVPTARALDTSALSPMLSRNAVSNTVPRLQPPRRYERAAGLTDPRPHTTPLGGGDDSGAAGSYPATGRGLLPRAPNPTIRIIPCDSSSGATPPTVHGGHVAATPALPAPGDNFAAFGTSAPAGAVPPDYDVIPGTGGSSGFTGAAAVGAHGPGSPGGRRELGCPSRRLATLIESEVREALDQVRARRLDISETLSDLDTLRQELELQQTTPDGPSGGESDTRDPGEEEARDTNDLATALMARMRPGLACHHQARSPPELPGTSHDVDATLSGDTSNTGLGINPPDPDVPPIRESTLRPEEAMEAGSLGDALDDLPSLDLEAPGLDGVGVEGGDSPASSGSGSSVDSLDRLLSIDDENNNGDDNNNNQDPEVTLNAIGSYSAEIERRVQQLDQRISEIQARLQDRLQSLQNERERGQTRMRGGRLSSTQYSSFSERLRQRHERLRAHLESLRQSYNTSRGRLGAPASAAGSNPEPVPSGEDGRSLPGQLTDHRNSRTTTPHDPHPQRGVDPWAPRNRPPFRDRIRNLRYEMARRRRDSRDQERSWHSLQRRHLHPHYAVGILDETVNRPDEGIRSAINRAIAGAFIASGESTVASNIMNTTYRIQRWDFYKYRIPDLTRIDENVVVPHCKIHNDATVDMSQDGRLLATFVPSHRGFPDDSILGVFSLQPDTFRRCLYTKSFGPNFVSVSLSPLNNYALVGLASKRLSWVFTPKQMVAQVFQLTNPMAGEDSVEHICDLMHPCDVDIRAPVSVNSARWLPTVGDGIVYGTNRGDLHICRPGFEQETKRPEAGDGTAAGGHPENTSIRRNLMHLLGMTVPRAISIATQTVQRVRRTASTQTDSEDL